MKQPIHKRDGRTLDHKTSKEFRRLAVRRVRDGEQPGDGWLAIEERTVSDMLRVPQAPFRLLVAFSAFMLCLQLLSDLGDLLKKLAGRAS